MFKFFTLIILAYFAYKLFFSQDTTIKIERRPPNKNIHSDEDNAEEFIDYEEMD